MVEDPIGKLTGTELNQAFGEGVEWLKEKVYDPLSPRKYHMFEGGHINADYQNPGIFHVKRNFKDGSEETYVISDETGLVSFTKEIRPDEVQSSILGPLHYDPNNRYFISHSRGDIILQFGTIWTKRESGKNHSARQALEEKKRAALRIIKVCQG